jgi:hypothetical protein
VFGHVRACHHARVFGLDPMARRLHIVGTVPNRVRQHATLKWLAYARRCPGGIAGAFWAFATKEKTMKTVVFWISLACALAACSGDKKLELGGSCSLNSDCAEPLLCKFGSCRKACMKSVDCENGGRCVTVDGVAVCQTQTESACVDGNCPTPLVCRTVDNTCRSACTGGGCLLSSQTCTGTVCVDSAELASPDASAGGIDGAATPDAGSPGPDVPVSTPDAVSPDVPLVTPDAPGLRADASAGAETAGETSGPLTCVDKDGDGYGVGAGCRGPDCDDTNTNVWISCGTCQDADGDGYFVGCDRYTSPIMGPDCDDTAPFCTNSCVDADKNGTADCAEYWFGEASSALGSVGVAPDGSYVFVGRSTSGGFGGNDIRVTKVSKTGRVLWGKLYGTANDEVLNTWLGSADGSIRIFGECGSARCPFLLHLDTDGKILRSRTVPTAANISIVQLAAELPNGNFAVGGEINGALWLGELAGDFLSFDWQSTYAGLRQSDPTQIVRLSTGDFVVGVGDWSQNQRVPSSLVVLGPKGEVRWARQGISTTYLGLALTSDGTGFLAAGFGAAEPLTVVSMTAAGDVTWARSTKFKASGAGSYSLINADGSGGILVAAHDRADYPQATLKQSWTFRLAADGTPIWGYSTGLFSPAPFAAPGGELVWGGGLVGRSPADPGAGSIQGASCVFTPATDSFASAQVSFTGLSLTKTDMTPPWVLADYPINTMPGAVTWKPICPAPTP